MIKLQGNREMNAEKREIDGKRPWKEIRFRHEGIDKGLEALARDGTRLKGN